MSDGIWLTLKPNRALFFIIIIFFSEHIMGLHCLVFLVLKASKPKRKGELKGISYFD